MDQDNQLLQRTERRCLQPCRYQRLLYVAGLHSQDAGLAVRPGSPTAPILQMVPAQLLSVTHPTCWTWMVLDPATNQGRAIAVRELVLALLAAVFCSLEPEAKAVGYEMAEEQHQQQQQQQPSLEGAELRSFAALCLFTNPPVRATSDGGFVEACMRVRRRNVGFVELETSNGCSYPHIVLQYACPASGLPKIKMPVYQLITHLTQGPMPPHASCVCHYDTDARIQGYNNSLLSWRGEPPLNHRGRAWKPAHAQCSGINGTMCVSPCCTFYSDQARNAATGAHHSRRPNRLARRSRDVHCRLQPCSRCDDPRAMQRRAAHQPGQRLKLELLRLGQGRRKNRAPAVQPDTGTGKQLRSRLLPAGQPAAVGSRGQQEL